jgi:calmodulin
MSKKLSEKEQACKSLGITEEKYDDYKDSFDYFDKDKSGDINIKELAALFRSMGQTVSDGELKLLIDDIDKSGDGEISFYEFMNLMVNKIERHESESNHENTKPNDIPDDDEIIKAFEVFDVDKSGTLNKIELRYILTSIGDKFTDAEVDDIFRQADLDGSGEIDYKEFIKFWRTKFLL